MKEHQKKLWCLIALATGTRGMEQHLLEVQHIERDVCPPGHPKEGMVFYCLVGLDHKRGKLSTTSVYADDDDSMKMLRYCNRKDGLCAASCLERYLVKLAPGQLRLYCRVKKDGSMSALQPLGKHTCAKMVKEVGIDAGIVDMQGWKPHVFRSRFLTMLANDPALNLSEVMAAGRHKSVSASLAYQRRNAASEAARFDSVERAMTGVKRGVEEDDDIDDEGALTPECKKMKPTMVLKKIPYSEGNLDPTVALKVDSNMKDGKDDDDTVDMHGQDVKNDDMAMESAELPDSSAKADFSSSKSNDAVDVKKSAKPVSFTFHFN